MKAALVGVIFALTGCSERIADLKCSDVEAEAIDMAKGKLIKITNTHVVSRSPSELICSGLGIYSDNSEIQTRYRAYLDEDQEIMVAYDTDQALAAEEAQEQRKTDAEIERATTAFNESVDRAIEPYQ